MTSIKTFSPIIKFARSSILHHDMRKRIIIGYLTGLALAGFILLCRLNACVADFYAVSIYPAVSMVFSAVSSVFPFSVNDLVITGSIAAIIAVIISSIRLGRKAEKGERDGKDGKDGKALMGGKAGWKRFLLQESMLGLWIFVWFYLGWGANYFRSDILTRAGRQWQEFDKEVFAQFLDNYTRQLNESYVEAVNSGKEGTDNSPEIDTPKGTIKIIDKTITISKSDMSEVEAAIKRYYAKVPAQYGLCKPRNWQHPKPMLFNRFQSATGVTGYMGPFCDEFHVSRDVLPQSYPFTFAHEYSHLMGVSSEAEANWWAFDACRTSDNAAIRYSAWYSILGHVWNNAAGLLEPAEFGAWKQSILPEIIDELRHEQEYWNTKRIPLLDRMQSTVYNAFLKGNRVSSGMKNYSEVIQIIIALDN